MPFSSALCFNYGNNDQVWMFYCFNLLIIGIALYIPWRFITNPKRKLSFTADDLLICKMAGLEALRLP